VPTEAVKSAKRTLDILALLTGREARMTFTEISEALDLPRSSLHGLLSTLTESGWVTYDSASRTSQRRVRPGSRSGPLLPPPGRDRAA
jgi:DNA-binding IclR family transcriptional regulator